MLASKFAQSESSLAFKAPSQISRSKWISGLSTLNRLWKRGLQPEDLRRHYFLHWFVVYNGNTIQGHFLELGYSKKSVRLRHTWQKMNEKSKNLSFEKKFHQFYQKFS